MTTVHPNQNLGQQHVVVGTHEREEATAQNDEQEWLFSCRCESAKAVSTLLSCLVAGEKDDALNNKNNTKSKRRKNPPAIQPMTVFCSPTRLTFQVFGTSRQNQASVEMHSGLFSDYRVLRSQDEETEEWQSGGEFAVNLTTVMECLHLLGTQSLERTKLCMSYCLTQELFKLELLEEGVLSTASIPGLIPPEEHELSLTHLFRSSDIVTRMIVKSDCLKDAIQELVLLQGASTCTISLGPRGLQLAAIGHVGEVLVVLPADSPAMINLEAPSEHARTFTLSSFMSGMRALDYAEESCISINAAGMIAIQHQVQDTVGQGNPNFADFIMTCLADDEDSSVGRTSQSSVVGGEASASIPQTSGWRNDDDKSTATSLSLRTQQPAPVTANVEEEEDDDDEERAIVVDDDDDDDKEQDEPHTSATPLFGVMESSHSRRKRQRTSKRRSAPTRPSARHDHEDEMPHTSDSLPEDEEQNVDIRINTQRTPRRGSRRRDREYDGSSSPELVYH